MLVYWFCKYSENKDTNF